MYKIWHCRLEGWKDGILMTGGYRATGAWLNTVWFLDLAAATDPAVTDQPWTRIMDISKVCKRQFRKYTFNCNQWRIYKAEERPFIVGRENVKNKRAATIISTPFIKYQCLAISEFRWRTPLSWNQLCRYYLAKKSWPILYFVSYYMHWVRLGHIVLTWVDVYFMISRLPTECPKIYRKSLLYMLQYTANLYLKGCSTDLR